MSALTLTIANEVRMTRARSFFPAALIVISSFYLIFAIAAGNLSEFLINLLIVTLFTGLALRGYLQSLWLVVLGLVVHGLFDFAYHFHGGGPAPVWWGAFCLTFDVVFAVGLTGVLRTASVSSNREE